MNDTLKEQPDKTELNNKIVEITEKMKALNEKDYSAEKWKALEDALNTAKKVAESNDADGGVVASAVEGLDNAFNGLEEDVMLGDVNGDGKISVSDITAIQLHLANKRPLTEKQLKAADVTNDGKVSVSDITKIQLKLANKIPEF